MPYSKPDIAPEWMKVNEVAAVLDVDPRTVIRMVKRGELNVRAIEFGKAIRIHRGDWQNELDRRAAALVGA
ncbi:helix-turn-helix domain-containing protein [Streptomyces osmaniensis]|uniref:Helix-turn-helix domain-containing protein n=1 Tax=Streptomyces osmaniensis TaxID=593134 RepID=A0ABP6Z0F0_9ACTN|nr:helix-turn-helix domain-containing protein [Streptomyces sp. JCM17656]